ncbi:DUF4405 domain-containing protein [Desulfosporosinus nitroreducens]|uniref:DUF4405 domain-containing protein n=1 Tax=Desulfosporosinus nitroreducens TaxID=2018668 RepID=A0ABT8QVC5_9FIRM|nr:DUF4405 domain-containing protein [Desulfosporosinus nitroreducens]MCO1604485.1 DUF4405 domain-containing protein [Desulfosporosinus nitroreducens]MDO0824519.1 DUF4405 domain-containing protein [Desulfosporosinus nitroreducens]
MNRKMSRKLAIDLVMTVLMLVAMASLITGNTIHELLGVSMFILFIVHNFLNRRWYQTVLTGKNNVLRVLNTAVNLLLLVTMAVLMVSAVPISRAIFAFIPINNGMIVRQIHVLAAYWGFILIAVHLGMHWRMILNAVRRITGITGTSRIRTIAVRVLAVLIVVYGVQASFDRNVGSKLIFYYTFDYLDVDESTLGFFIDYLSIMGIYICGTYYALKFVQKREEAKAFKEQLR